MWLLENDGDVFGGKKLWLRPGKRYLLGRTNYGTGSIAIDDKTISRKHITIEVADVPEGKSADLRSRSTVTVEDLKTKLGTWLNDKSINGERLDLVKGENEVKLGRYDKLFRITWHPVVLSFTFTKAELQQPGVWAIVQKNLEPLDIKYTAEYDSEHTTHVVVKKLGNTSKVLQTLIDGKPFVTEGFVTAVAAAATLHPDENGVETSELEDDFEGAWPKAVEYLPPRAEGPGADRPPAVFAPNLRRRDIFEGYTFIFYERKRFDDLFPVICSGKGKALLKEAIPGRTEIDDFIRYVKSIAGEKGLGEFEDGSERRGVVVVRYVPSTGDPTDNWYLDFYNQVALRLDHRPIETRDFLPAILDVEPAQLRRALEVEPTPREPATQTQATDVDQGRPPSPIKESPPPVSRRARQREAPKSRFRGFDHSSDSDNDDDEAAQATAARQPDNAASQPQPLQRKRPAPERDIMDELAPTAAAIKRMRLETGRDPLPAAPTPPPPPPPTKQAEAPKDTAKARAAAPAKNSKGKKSAVVSDEDFLNQFLAEGQEEEANLRAEREQLARELAEGTIDFDDIRQGIAEEMVEVRRPQGVPRQGNQDERWDPRWNGLRNFKKFGRQGRQQPRNIIPLEPVKAKEIAAGGDYWLEERRWKFAKRREARQAQTQGRSQANHRTQAAPTRDDSDAQESELDEAIFGGRARESFPLPDIMDLEPAAAAAPAAAAPSRSRKGKAAEKAGQAVRVPTGGRGAQQQKRAAAEPLASEKPAKRARATRSTRLAAESSDEDQDGEENEDDDSEGEGLNFRFGKRK